MNDRSIEKKNTYIHTNFNQKSLELSTHKLIAHKDFYVIIVFVYFFVKL